MTARVALKSLPDEKPIWENPAYTFRENYSFDGSRAPTSTARTRRSTRSPEKFAESLVASLLEGF